MTATITFIGGMVRVHAEWWDDRIRGMLSVDVETTPDLLHAVLPAEVMDELRGQMASFLDLSGGAVHGK